MSKKALLNETQVRKMMKLASLSGPLTSNFLTEKYGTYMDEDEHGVEEGYGMQEDEDDMEEGHGMMKHGMDEVGHGMEEAHGGMHEDDMEEGHGMYEDDADKEVLEGEHEEAPEDEGPEDAALDLEEPAPEGGTSEKETKFASAIATLADLAGVEVDFGDMGGMDADMMADTAGDEDMAADLADLGDMGDMGEEEPLDEIDFIDEEEVMNEVYKRVKNRLKEKLLSDK